MHANRRRPVPLLSIVVFLLCAGFIEYGGHAAAMRTVATTEGCALWASTSSDDNATGSAADPFRTLGHLFAVLAAGQTGCLLGGTTYEAVEGDGIIGSSNGTASSPVTLRSAGGSGQARIEGWVEVSSAAHDIVLRDLRFVGSPTNAAGDPIEPKSTHINLLGDRITLTGNDISDPFGICINAGRIDAYQSADPGEPSDGIVIDSNRVHDCGNSPKLIWTDRDSGAHGIYLVWTRDARVTNNLIYRNQWRGFQQWPRGERTLLANNLFFANATHVNIGSALTDGYPWYSTGTTVRDNIMVGKTSFRSEDNQASFAGNFPEGSPDYGNALVGNCIAPDAPATAGAGFTETGTVSATPQFSNLAADDFRLTASSPCQGKGPASIQPTQSTPTRSFQASTASCAGTAVRAGVPLAMTSATAGGERVFWKPTLFQWTSATGWVRRDTTKPWLAAASSGAPMQWVSYDAYRTPFGPGSAVVFSGLPHGYYAVGQTFYWSSDAHRETPTLRMTGSPSAVWCRL